jgi:hypothetical protein
MSLVNTLHPFEKIFLLCIDDKEYTLEEAGNIVNKRMREVIIKYKIDIRNKWINKDKFYSDVIKGLING